MPWHFNRKGSYHYGHSYPMQKRVQVIAMYLATFFTAITAEIVSNNAFKENCVVDGGLHLEALVRIYPTIYLQELQKILANDFQLGPHEVPLIAAIARLFTKLKIMRKKCVHVAKEQMSPHNRYCRQSFSVGENYWSKPRLFFRRNSF